MTQPAKMQILIIGKIPEDLSKKLEPLGTVSCIERNDSLPEAEIIAAAKNADILLTEPPDKITPALIAACPQLKMIAQRAVGYDNINLKDLESRPILATNTPGVLDNATADLAFALLLAAARRIVEADRYVRELHWQGFENDLLLGCEISGRTIGIVGMGRIGTAMARRARGFGMNVIYSRSSQDINQKDQKDQQWLSELQAQRVTLTELLQQSDFISLHCPHNKETEKLIGTKEFALMKKNCVFVNTARGKVVDEEALIEALRNKQIRAAGLDVFYNEPKVNPYLIEASNVVLTPHIGSASEETRHAMAELSVNSILQAFAGNLPGNALNKEVFTSWSAKFKNQ